MRIAIWIALLVSFASLATVSQAQVVEQASSTTILSQDVTLAPDVAMPKQHVLLAGIGGWKSCLGQANDQYISNRFLAMVNNLRRCRPDLDISYVMYCSPGLKSISGDSHVRVYGRFGTSTVAEKNIGASIAQHKPTPDTLVFVMGHSHGGWMAMRATLCLGDVAGLFTMEPVSASLCNTKDYLENRTRKIFKRRQNIVPDCRRAPTDVDNAGVLMAAGGNWVNYFLAPNTQKGDIYSSPIAEAMNEMIWAPAEGKYNAHHNLGMSATTWSSIENHILSRVSMTSVSLPIIQPLTEIETEQQTLSVELIDQAATETTRTWWDKTGKYTRTGELLSVDDGIVQLRLVDGQPIDVELAALSDEDQAWIAGHARVD